MAANLQSRVEAEGGDLRAVGGQSWRRLALTRRKQIYEISCLEKIHGGISLAMPDCNRCRIPKIVSAAFVACLFALAVAAIFATGASTALKREQQYRNAAKYAADAEREIEQRCLLLQPIAMAECIRDIVEATNEHNRAEDDRVAQSEMAWWAFWMVIISGAGLFITIYGIYYVSLTLRENRKAVEAAQELIAIETKPFLSIRPLDGGSFDWDQSTGKVFITKRGPGLHGRRRGRKTHKSTSLFCEIKSSGRSPAILTGICRRWVSCPQNKFPDEIIPARGVHDVVSIPVGPDGIIMAMLSEHPVKPESETHHLTFYGYMEFTDIAGTATYVSGFAFNYDPVRWPGRGLVTARFPDGKYWYHQKVEAQAK